MEEKICSICKTTKCLDEFPVDRRARDRRASNCKACQSAKRRVWAGKQASRPSKAAVRAANVLESGEKKCSKCGEIKSLAEYHKDARSKDGLYSHCKKCHYAMTHAYEQSEQGKAIVSQSKRKAYVERDGKEKGRLRNATENARLKRVAYRLSEAGREAERKKYLRRKERHPQRMRAKTTVGNAVKSGVLPPVNTLKCARCGNQAEHYHHESYAEEDFLRVTPLCQKCHAKTYTQTYG